MFLRKSISTIFDISKNYKSEVTALVKFHKSMADTADVSCIYVLLLIQCSIGLIDLTYLITTVLSFAGIGYMTLHLHSNEFNIDSVSRSYSSTRSELESQLKDIKEKIETTQTSTDHISNFIDAL